MVVQTLRSQPESVCSFELVQTQTDPYNYKNDWLWTPDDLQNLDPEDPRDE